MAAEANNPLGEEYTNNAWVVEYRQARAYQSGEKTFGTSGRYELSEDQCAKSDHQATTRTVQRSPR